MLRTSSAVQGVHCVRGQGDADARWREEVTARVLHLDEFFSVWLWVHRLVGYPTAFVVAPLAMVNFAGVRVHRRWGKLYALSMVFLYTTGTVMSFRHHALLSWDLARSLTFNLAGFSAVLLGWRSIRLLHRSADGLPSVLDRVLLGLLAAGGIGLCLVGLTSFPMLVFGVFALVLAYLDLRDLLGPIRTKRVQLSRHVRYMFASFFYMLTLLSVLHVQAPQALRWLWPWFIGVPAIVTVSRGWNGVGATSPARLTRVAVWGTVAVTYCLGAYILVSAAAAHMSSLLARS